MSEGWPGHRSAALSSCVRKCATDAGVIHWFNRTYGTKLKAPILELIGNADEQERRRGAAQAAGDVNMFVQFIIVVLWPRLQQQIEQPKSVPWAGLANALARRAAAGAKSAARNIGVLRWNRISARLGPRIDSLSLQ